MKEIQIIIINFFKWVCKTMTKQEMFMQEALIEARKAFLKNEVPVGCVVLNDKIILELIIKETLNSTLAHAELKQLKSNKELGSI